MVIHINAHRPERISDICMTWVRWRVKPSPSRPVPGSACPHGGGEGRSPIGRAKPVTPWGKPALGIKTRKATKASSRYILRGRR